MNKKRFVKVPIVAVLLILIILKQSLFGRAMLFVASRAFKTAVWLVSFFRTDKHMML